MATKPINPWCWYIKTYSPGWVIKGKCWDSPTYISYYISYGIYIYGDFHIYMFGIYMVMFQHHGVEEYMGVLVAQRHSDHQDLGSAALQCLVVFGGSFDLRSGPTAFVPR
jgi:hypothetical protein